MKIFTCNQKITVSDIGQDFLVTNKGIIRILQEAANLASSEVGYGINNIENTGKTWVLLYWRLKVIKRVKYNEEITVKTWTEFNKKIYSIRYFKLYDSKDELIGIADSKWVFVDAKNHTIQKITDDLIDAYGVCEEKLFETELVDKIKMPQDIKESYSYTTMKRDLDANHHVNNLSFLDIAVEALPDNLKDNDFANVSIIFKKEILYKDTVTCYYSHENEKHVVYLYTKSNNLLNGAVIFE